MLITCSLSAEGSATPTKGHRSLELIFQLRALAFYVAPPSSSALITQRWCLLHSVKTVTPALRRGETEARRDLWMLKLSTHSRVTARVPSAARWHLVWGGDTRIWDVSRWPEPVLPWLSASQGCALPTVGRPSPSQPFEDSFGTRRFP